MCNKVERHRISPDQQIIERLASNPRKTGLEWFDSLTQTMTLSFQKSHVKQIPQVHLEGLFLGESNA